MSNFNLKKFLVENKLTSNSKILNEASEKSEALAKAKTSHNKTMSKLKGQSQGASGGVTRAREDKEIERYEKEVERINKKFTNKDEQVNENFAPSPNENLGVEEADYSVEKAFIKAGIDMTKPVFVIDSEASGLGGDNVDKPRQEDAKYLAEHIDGERRVYLSEYQEGDDFPVFYEFENNTIFPEQIPQGAEYKLCVSFAEIKDYSILQ